jgi:hypothetical protein
MAEDAMDGTGPATASSLEELEGRFRQWRESRRRGDHIPPQLWEAAVDMAREHGVPRVANRLRLNTAFLNKRLAAAAGQPRTEAAQPQPEFVELLTAPAAPVAATVAGVHECVVELHNARGAKMRVELNAGGLAGLAHLCRAFWGAA